MAEDGTDARLAEAVARIAEAERIATERLEQYFRDTQDLRTAIVEAWKAGFREVIGQLAKALVREIEARERGEMTFTAMDELPPFRRPIRLFAAPPPLGRTHHHPVEDWRTGPRRRRLPRKMP